MQESQDNYMKANITKKQIQESVKNSLTMNEAWVRLGKKVDKKTFRRYAKLFGLWYPNRGRKGRIGSHNKLTKDGFINTVLVLNGNKAWRSNYKNKLYEYKLKKEKCEICGQGSIWNNKKLVLQVDHINGDKNDNRLENLRVLCPNCHSQTKTFSCKKAPVDELV